MSVLICIFLPSYNLQLFTKSNRFSAEAKVYDLPIFIFIFIQTCMCVCVATRPVCFLEIRVGGLTKLRLAALLERMASWLGGLLILIKCAADVGSCFFLSKSRIGTLGENCFYSTSRIIIHRNFASLKFSLLVWDISLYQVLGCLLSSFSLS